jgi:hypothetical protein
MKAMKNTGREINLGLRTINFEEIGHIIENELTQNELVTLIKIIKETLDERNNGVGDFLDVRFFTRGISTFPIYKTTNNEEA